MFLTAGAADNNLSFRKSLKAIENSFKSTYKDYKTASSDEMQDVFEADSKIVNATLFLYKDQPLSKVNKQFRKLEYNIPLYIKYNPAFTKLDKLIADRNNKALQGDK